jgi:hypothetical protein
MAEFESWRDYFTFAHFVTCKARHVLDAKSQHFLKAVLETSEKRKTPVEKGVNVQIAPIEHGTVKVEFPRFGLLQVKDRNAPLMNISRVITEAPGRLVQEGYMPSTQTLADLIRRHDFPDSFTVQIRYEDLSRTPYQTGFNVRFDPIRDRFDVTFDGLMKHRSPFLRQTWLPHPPSQIFSR